jgi:hypothetical protein
VKLYTWVTHIYVKSSSEALNLGIVFFVGEKATKSGRRVHWEGALWNHE